MKQRALAVAFAVWLAGVQIAELFAVIGAVAVAALLIAELVVQKRRPVVTPDEWLIVAFVSGAVFLPLLGGELPTGTGLARILALATIPVAAATATRLSAGQLRAALIAGGVVLVGSSIIAALQHFGAWPAAERLELLTALKLPVARVYEEVPAAPGRYMAGGLLFHRLKYAHVSGLAVLAAAGTALSASGRDRLIAACVALAGLVSVFWFPFARAASVALAGALLVLAVIAAMRTAGRARNVVLGAGAAVVAVGVLVVALNQPLRTRLLRAETEEGSGGRAHLLEAGLTAARTKPFTGLGLGRFKAADWAPAGAPSYVAEHQGKTHNQLLSIAAESGLIAALLFVVYLLALAIRMWRSRSPPSALASLAFFVALCLLHDPLFHAEFGLALGLALGAPLNRASDAATASISPHRRRGTSA